MKRKLSCIIALLCFSASTIYPQSFVLKLINTTSSTPLTGVHISIVEDSGKLLKLKLIAVTDTLGVAQIDLNLKPSNRERLLFSHVTYQSKVIYSTILNLSQTNIIEMVERVRELQTVEVVFSEPYIDQELISIPTTTISINGTSRVVKAFQVQKNEVTVGQFKTFIEETGYITEVEKKEMKVSVLKLTQATDSYLKRFKTIKKESFKRAKKTRFQGWERKFQLVKRTGINWRHDEFGNLREDDEMDFPVINITWTDANSYASWVNMRLPSHEEWIASAEGSKIIGWYRKLSTGVLKSVSSSPTSRKGIQNLFGNAAEFLSEQIVLEGKKYRKSTSFHSFASEYTEITETLLFDESEVLNDWIKYGFRCVRSQDQ